MALPWKLRYQYNGVGWCPLLLCNGNSSYYSYYITPTVVGWCIAILRFLFTIITSPWLLSVDVLLFYISFSLLLLLFLLLHHPDCCRVMYCYSTFLFHYDYYINPTVVGWCIAILRFFFTMIITSTRLLSGDVLLFHVSFSLLLLHHPDCCRVMYCYSTFLFHYYYYSSTRFCPLDFSEMPWSNFMKPCRNIICHVKLCC